MNLVQYADGGLAFEVSTNDPFFTRLKERAMADNTPLTFGTVIAVRRRRDSGQQRLRRVADQLDQLARPVPFGPLRKELEPPTLTAAQLRLAADLLDVTDWGQAP